ncbi:MAG: thioredoxin domain-containing protein, partial [Nitriliruptoraceae bacterium]
WCHVMAHESFEDEEVAATLNEAFVNIKVDREERPDVDAVYMQAVQAMTGRGGWPMSVFLTPDGAPFFCGTYWPRQPVHGMPDFPTVLSAVREAWDERREEVLDSAQQISTALAERTSGTAAADLDPEIVDGAVALVLERAWDRHLGGFGAAPKFPQAMTIEWLLAHHQRTGHEEALEAAVHSLDAMARGGIHDQLAGGFARYATDAAWLVPHFEKMLYDNALLLPAYATAAQLTGRDDLARIARSTARWLLEVARGDEGTFVSAFDADSEGVEGRFYVWPYDELVGALQEIGADAQLWTDFLGARSGGNWEGVNILHEPTPRVEFAAQRGMDEEAFDTEWERVRGHLLARRAERVPPGVDHKALTDWNALAVRGLVRAGIALDELGWVQAAAEVAEVLHDRHVVDGRLHHVRTAGRTAVPGFLDDHAALALADLELLAATGQTRWFRRAVALARDVEERFLDPAEGGWFQTAEDAEALASRPKDTFDNAVPAGTAVMIEVCLRLAGLTGDLTWRHRAEEALRLVQPFAAQAPTGAGWSLRQLEAIAAGPREVVIVGPPGGERDRLLAAARARTGPGTLVLAIEEDDGVVPLLEGRVPIDGQPTAYVCRELACHRPVTSPAALEEQLASAGGPADGP